MRTIYADCACDFLYRVLPVLHDAGFGLLSVGSLSGSEVRLELRGPDDLIPPECGGRVCRVLFNVEEYGSQRMTKVLSIEAVS